MKYSNFLLTRIIRPCVLLKCIHCSNILVTRIQCSHMNQMPKCYSNPPKYFLTVKKIIHKMFKCSFNTHKTFKCFFTLINYSNVLFRHIKCVNVLARIKIPNVPLTFIKCSNDRLTPKECFNVFLTHMKCLDAPLTLIKFWNLLKRIKCLNILLICIVFLKVHFRKKKTCSNILLPGIKDE